MAIDAKVDFMNQLEARLADVITASEMTKTLAAVAEVMDNFQIAVDATAEADMKDDLLNAFTCPFSYMIRSGKNEGRTMCTAMESRAFARMIREPKVTYNPEGFMVDNHYTDRPCGCPIIAELEVDECTE